MSFTYPRGLSASAVTGTIVIVTFAGTATSVATVGAAIASPVAVKNKVHDNQRDQQSEPAVIVATAHFVFPPFS